MAVRKLRPLDGTTVGVSLPIDDLRELDGVVDENGEIVHEQQVHIQRTDDGVYRVELLDSGTGARPR